MLETDRLILRAWREEDLAPMARMNADTEVMRFFPATQTLAETEAAYGRVSAHMEKHGFCFFAAELKETSSCIGFIGMQHVPEQIPCAPAVEIGWRLDKSVWGQGLAPEGAKACLAYGFSVLKLDEIVSFTAEINKPSQRVMEKIGMTRDESGDFEHPAVSRDNPVRPHVLYRMSPDQIIGS